MSWKRRAREGAYHHGNLREALIQAARELIKEKGPAGFTFADAARSAGVSPAAPYRHFRDREALLADVAREGFTRFEAMLTTGWANGKPDALTAFHNVGRATGSFKGAKPFFTRGSNYRMQQFQAVILMQQFDKLVQETARRRENADYLSAHLKQIPGIQPARLPENSRAVWHLYPATTRSISTGWPATSSSKRSTPRASPVRAAITNSISTACSMRRSTRADSSVSSAPSG